MVMIQKLGCQSLRGGGDGDDTEVGLPKLTWLTSQRTKISVFLAEACKLLTLRPWPCLLMVCLYRIYLLTRS